MEINNKRKTKVLLVGCSIEWKEKGANTEKMKWTKWKVEWRKWKWNKEEEWKEEEKNEKGNNNEWKENKLVYFCTLPEIQILINRSNV